MNLKPFFSSVILIHSKKWQPAVFIKRFIYQGKTYVRVAFPNRRKDNNTMPITDILNEDVTAIEKKPSPFKKWLFSLVGAKPKPRMFIIDHPNGKPVLSLSKKMKNAD